MEKIKVEIDLTGHHYNDWPYFQIYHDEILLLDDYARGQNTYKFDLECQATSAIKIRHYRKCFGENGIFDTSSDGQQDRFIKINDIRFNDVGIGEKLMAQLMFVTEWSDYQISASTKDFISQYSQFACHGRLSFNGHVNFEFTTPIYNWLTIKKYKIDQIESAYFSNYSKNWHYEEDLRLIKEIKGLMNLD